MKRVVDVMNPELYSCRISDDVGETLGMILRLGITAAPVVDEESMAVGVVSLRDLAAATLGDVVGTHMTTPACTIAAHADLTDAARVMGATEYHHLVVVDADGRVTGFVSSLDVLRGMIDMPSEHPPGFPQLDTDSGLSWTGPMPLEREQLDLVPRTAGMIVLVADGLGPAERVVWREASTDLRERLEHLVAGNVTLPEELRRGIGDKKLKFRAAEFDRGGRSLAETIEGNE